MSCTFTHVLQEEIFSIAGRYELEKEGKIELHGREVLYVVGQALIDTSCCGYGGCCYAVVPGFILSWKTGTNQRGLPTSVVDPIEDERTRVKISEMIKNSEQVSQVQFW